MCVCVCVGKTIGFANGKCKTTYRTRVTWKSRKKNKRFCRRSIYNCPPLRYYGRSQTESKVTKRALSLSYTISKHTRLVFVFNSNRTLVRSNLLQFFAIQFKMKNVLKTKIILHFLNGDCYFYFIFYWRRRLYVIKIHHVKSIASQRHAYVFFPEK